MTKVQVTVQAQEALLLPRYLGSTIRGAFGWALRDAGCFCETDDHEPSCAYARLFEPTITKEAASTLRVSQDAPPGFLFDLPLEGPRIVPPGALFCWGLTLIGSVARQLPRFVQAVERMGQLYGLGRRGDRPDRGRFQLVDVRDTAGRLLYDGPSDTWEALPPAQPLMPEISDTPVSSLHVRFKTPARITTRLGRPRKDFLVPHLAIDFWALIEAIYHRLYVLDALYGQGMCERYNSRALIFDTEEARLSKAHVEWYDWKRHSNRQDRSHKLGGFIGDVFFEGALTRYVPLLLAGQHVHAGKGTTFGMGNYDVLDP